MALTFPLSLAQFLDQLRIETFTLDTPGAFERSVGGDGTILTRQLAPRLWAGSVTTSNYRYACAEERRAFLDVLRTPGASFLMGNPRYAGPSKRAGAAYPAAKLTAVAANNRDVSFSGLTFDLSPGDYVSWAYGANPLRYALHQIVSKSGTTYEVTPPVRAGWVAGQAVELQRPAFKAVVDPGSIKAGSIGPVATSGVSFDFIQTLR